MHLYLTLGRGLASYARALELKKSFRYNDSVVTGTSLYVLDSPYSGCNNGFVLLPRSVVIGPFSSPLGDYLL